MAAVEKFRKTNVWTAPSGLDIDLDVHEIKKMAEGQLVRSKEPSQSSVSRISASGPPGGGGGGGGSGKSSARPNTMPIKKKKAPLSARGRMQEGGAFEDAHASPAPARAAARPSSAHSASQSYTQNISEDIPDSSLAHVAQPAAEAGESEEGGGGGHEYDSARQQQTHYEQQQYAHEHVNREDQYASDFDMVDIRQYRNESQYAAASYHSREALRPASTGHSLKMRKGGGQRNSSSSGQQHSKAVPAWIPKNTPPKSQFQSERSNKYQGDKHGDKLVDAYSRPAKKVCHTRAYSVYTSICLYA
jgi:hypothetical protein